MGNELKKVKFVQLRSAGKTYNEISQEIEISKPTLVEWSKELEAELNNEIEIYKEEIRKKFRLDFERQMQLKAKILDKLEAEVLSNDFSEIPKIKIIELILKITDSMGEPNRFKFKGIDLGFESVTEWIG